MEASWPEARLYESRTIRRRLTESRNPQERLNRLARLLTPQCERLSSFSRSRERIRVCRRTGSSERKHRRRWVRCRQTTGGESASCRSPNDDRASDVLVLHQVVMPKIASKLNKKIVTTIAARIQIQESALWGGSLYHCSSQIEGLLLA